MDSASAINDLGQIVGSNFIYEDGELLDLNDVIESIASYGDLKTSDINELSQIIGSATINGATHAILLNPCEPISYYRDSDGDTYGDLKDELTLCLQPDGYVPDSSDCDDTDRLIFPGAVEADNNIDDNCDGQADEGFQDNPVLNPSGTEDNTPTGDSSSSGRFVASARWRS